MKNVYAQVGFGAGLFLEKFGSAFFSQVSDPDPV